MDLNDKNCIKHKNLIHLHCLTSTNSAQNDIINLTVG